MNVNRKEVAVRKRGLPPILDSKTRILILGSFPGEASLAAEQYYAHPRNRFWELLSAVLEEKLENLLYPARLARLRSHRIGLWDVYSACDREGSLDSAIRRGKANDVFALRRQYPGLVRICFNGKTAGRFAEQFKGAGFDTLELPSSSPANTRYSLAQKVAKWRRIVR